MYRILNALFVILNTSAIAQQNINSNDALIYQCQFKYTWVRDTSQKSMKLQDQMCLDIYSKNHAVYFSIPKQIGLKRLDEDRKNQISLEDAAKNSANYHTYADAEILLTDFNSNSYKMLDKLSSKNYYYISSVESIEWKIESDTLTILNFICQKATGRYCGRVYTAWFAKEISLPYGPFKFSGLPGLILKIYDNKEEFVFECTELLNKSALIDMPYYEAYQNPEKITKQDLFKIKKLFFENYPAYLMAEKGIVFKPNDPNEYKSSTSRHYNFIEL